MTGGLEVLGAVSASYALAKELAIFVREFIRADDSLVSLGTRFDDDVSLLGHLKRIFEEEGSSLSQEDSDHVVRIFLHIQLQLQATKTKVEKYGRRGIWDKVKWAAVGSDLEKAEKELYIWSQRLETRLSLLPRRVKESILAAVVNGQKGQETDEERAKLPGLQAQLSMEMMFANITDGYDQPANRVARGRWVLVESTAGIATNPQLCLLDGKQTLLVERKRVPSSVMNSPDYTKSVISEVSKIVRVLQAADPIRMNIFRAYGFTAEAPNAKEATKEEPSILYSIPKKYLHTLTKFHHLPTLSTLLSNRDTRGHFEIPKHPLHQRYELARQIATATLYVHAAGFIHKALRSSNIVICPEPSQAHASPLSIGTAFLVGFEYARRSIDTTIGDRGSSDEDWRDETYRHPEQQQRGEDLALEQTYHERHDLYSLGVILLELGRWRPFEQRDFGDRTPLQRNERLMAFAAKLSMALGARYQRLVESCLRPEETEIKTQFVVAELEELVAATK